MGIEGASNNNEVQSQEIQQANIEQQAQNQEAHQRSGEELEANSTIDNEGERKQIEGKDDATEEMDSSSSKLEEKDSIEDDFQNNDVQDAETAQTEQSALDTQDTIVSDAATGVEEPADTDEQQVDALETNNEIVDSANEGDLLENDGADTEESSLDSLDSINDAPEEDVDDEQTETSDLENNSKIEDDTSENESEGENIDNEPESEDTDNKLESENTDNKPESEDTDNKSESEESVDGKPESDDADNKPESEEAANKPESDGADSNTDNSDNNTDNAESNGDAKKTEKLEDLTWDQIDKMMQTPEGKAELMRLNADFRERYEADMRGMTQEEYQDYKAACERYKAEQEAKEKAGNPEHVEPSDAQKKADDVLARFDAMDGKSSRAYMSGAKAQDLKDLSDSNSRYIAELKDVRNEVANEKVATYDKIASMNYDGTKESNPGEYRKLCDQYYKLEGMEKDLDYAVVKMDMNNWDISQVTGMEYRDSGKKMEKSDIDKTFSDADSILRDGVSDDKSIMDAYRVGEKLEHDVLPSLDGERREIDSQINVFESAQESYLKEHHCTHEEAMAHPDGEYARTDRSIQQMKAESTAITEKMTDAVEKATVLHDQVPVAGSDCKLKVIDNKNGTVTIERSWDNGGARERSREGRFHNSEATSYRNAIERKDSITLGQNSDSVYAHSFSFQYRGLGFKREDTFGGEGVKLKNSAEGGFLNFNASFGYKRGTEGKMSTLSADVSGSLAQFKDTASVVVKDKEYAKFSADVSVLKASVSAKMDSSGVAKVIASSHIVGGEASATISGVTVAKVSGALGEAKASASNDFLDMKASASVGDYKTSVSTWDALKSPKEGGDSNSDKHLIVGNISGSLGNGTTLASEKFSSTSGEWKGSNVVEQVKKDASTLVDGLNTGHLDINTDTVKGIVKDVEAVHGIKDKGFGVDVSKKPEEVVLGNSGIKEAKEVTDRPTDFEAKVVDHSSLPERTSETHEVAQDIKTSLEPFAQSKWDNMSFEQRAEAVDNLANSIANDLRLENRPDVKYYQSDKPGDFGGFSASENAIYINANNMGDAAETADTIAHESRHCWQHEMAEKSDDPKAQEYRENFAHYRRPERNYEAYLEQPVEKDAREYALDIRENIPETKEIETHKSGEETESKSPSFAEVNKEKGAVFDVKQKPDDIDSKLNISEVVTKISTAESPAKEYQDVLKNSVYNDRRFSAEGMVKEGMKLYDSLPDGKRTDINPVNNSKAIRTDEASLRDGIEKGYISISWHKYHGLDESKPINGVINSDGSSNMPDVLYRRGSGYGNNLTCRNVDGTLPTTNEIAVPYEDNPEAMHAYQVDSNTYKDVIDIISGVDESNSTDLDRRVDAVNDIIDKMNAEHKTSERHIDADYLLEQKEAYDKFQNSDDSNLCRNSAWKTDATYGVCGTVAPMHIDDDPSKEKLYDGGAAQFNTPMSINVFIRTGAMWEER